MAGRGAWPHFVHPGDDYRNDPNGREGTCIKVLKRELIYNGYAHGIVPELPFWGSSAVKQCMAFQAKNGLTPDGVVGPRTCTALFRKRAQFFEMRFGVKSPILQKLKTVESLNDPVAQGTLDKDDEGLMQINLHFHPAITIEQAWDPEFALEFAARYLVSAHDYTGDWDGAVVSYNIGRVYAKRWVAAGKPSSGGPMIGSQDSFTRATAYLKAVIAAPS